MTVAAIIGVEIAVGPETEARTGEQTLTVTETAIVGTRAVIAAMIEDVIEAVTEAVIGVVVVVATVAAIVVVIELDMTKNVKTLRRGLGILSLVRGLSFVCLLYKWFKLSKRVRCFLMRFVSCKYRG